MKFQIYYKFELIFKKICNLFMTYNYHSVSGTDTTGADVYKSQNWNIKMHTVPGFHSKKMLFGTLETLTSRERAYETQINHLLSRDSNTKKLKFYDFVICKRLNWSRVKITPGKILYHWLC